MTFDGFVPDTLTFLSELETHNDRAWFSRNRARYDDSLLTRERAFVEAVGARFTPIRPGVEAVPRVNGSIFRINRDTRFSKDKTPYKTYADMWFWEGADRKTTSGFFVRIVPEEIWIGAGAHTLSPEGLERLRAAVADEATGAPLVDTLTELGARGYRIGDQGYKRVPRGYPSDHPRAELLKHRSLHAVKREPVPEELFSAAFVDWCFERFTEVEPVHEWLVGTLS